MTPPAALRRRPGPSAGSGRRRWARLAWAAPAAALLLASGTPGYRPPRLDAAGATVDREIGAGERQAWAVRLGRGDFLEAEAVPSRGDVALAVDAPGTRSRTAVLDVDDPAFPAAPETVFLIAPRAGEYRLSVRARAGVAGRYRLRLAARRPANSQDRRRVEALAATVRGFATSRADDAAAYRRAAGDLARAAELWQRAGDPTRQAMALNHVGLWSWNLGDEARAVAAYGQALACARGAGSAFWEAWSLQNLGELHAAQGEAESALPELRRALALFRRLGDRRGEALALNDMGQMLAERGERGPGLDLLAQAAAAARAGGDAGAAATALHNVASLYDRREDYWRALELYRRSLALTLTGGDRRDLAASFNQIGRVLDLLGDKESALDYYRRTLTLVRRVGARAWEAETLHSIAGVHLGQGDLPRARATYQHALALSRAAGDRRGEAGRLSGLGQVHAALGETARARQLFASALAIRREIDDRRGLALTLRHQGRLEAAAGQAAAARRDYQEALALARDLDIPGLEAAVLDGLAGLDLAAGDFPSALARAEAAARLAESLRARIPGEDLRATYFAGFVSHHRRALQVLMAWHRREPGRRLDERALAMSERLRARSLLDALTGAAGPPPAEWVSAVRRELSTAAFRHYQLARDPRSRRQAEAQARRVRDLLVRYEEARARPPAAARPGETAAADPLALDAAWRHRHLDAGTLLVEISLGAAESYLWEVSRAGIASHFLPPGAELEAAAHRLRLLATERNRPHPSARAGEAASAHADERLAGELAALSRILLSPLAGLDRAHRLVFVVDGALDSVPFAALPVPARGSAATRGGAAPRRPEPLASRHEVVTLPSASLLTALRARRRAPASGPTIAIFADPVFDPGDPRLAGPRAASRQRPSGAPDEASLARAASAMGLAGDLADGLPRLPYTRREAVALARLVPPGEAVVALGFDATRERARSPEIARARILHFATHSLVNPVHPQLSGIVLSLVDHQGREDDGFLRLTEIPALGLRSDLVVLSACQTAAGRLVPGEGVLSLARGFLQAGAGGVVASLWPVDEVATARFMELFYRHLLGEGLPPAAALRQAQLGLAREERWRSPYYWSAFVLQGDWRSHAPS